MTKIFLYVSALLLVASAGLGFVNRKTLTERQAEIATVKASQTTAMTDAATAKSAQKKAESAKTEAESALNSLKAQEATTASEVATLKAQVDTANEGVKAKQAEIDALNVKLAAATPPPAMTPAPGANEELDKLKHQLAELQLIKDGLQNQVKVAQAAQQAAEIRVARRDSNDALNGLQGRVLAVDRNWNFVVLNLGGRSGVNANTTMVIRRGGSMVGRVRVTSVEPSQSIADIVPNSVPAGVSVQAGDTVVYAGGS